MHESEKAKDPVHKLRKEGEKVYTILGEILGKVSLYDVGRYFCKLTYFRGYLFLHFCPHAFSQ